MQPRVGRWNFYLGMLGVFTALLVSGGFARGQVVYQLDAGDREEIFNNSEFGDDSEDNWVANSFQAVHGATHLVSVTFQLGRPGFVDQPITVLIYQGSSLTDPTAGGGLVLLSATNTTFTAHA